MAIPATLLAEVAERFGTPLYIYDGDAMRRHLNTLRSRVTYRPLRILFSVKANSAVGIASLLREQGAGADVCSSGDLLVARRAGFRRGAISWAGFAATDNELREALSLAGSVVLDAVGELGRVAVLAPGASVGLRVNPGIDAGFHPHVRAGAVDSKFGIPADEVLAAVAHAQHLGLRIVGLHAHIGSDVPSIEFHRRLLELLTQLASACEMVEWINLGGGWPTPRRAGSLDDFGWEELDEDARRLLPKLGDCQIELRLEPGGYLTMDAGVVLARVRAVKVATTDRTRIVALDASTNHLASIPLYGAYHPIELVGGGAGSDKRPCKLVGDLMQAGDVLAEAAELPDVAPGDLIGIGLAGAYASSRATTFNNRPRAGEVLVDRGRATLIRRPEKIDDLLARDVWPR